MTEPFIDICAKRRACKLVVCYRESILLAGKSFGESFVQIFCFNEFFLFLASQYGIYSNIITLENGAIVSDESKQQQKTDWIVLKYKNKNKNKLKLQIMKIVIVKIDFY
jgi:hypothetical protein